MGVVSRAEADAKRVTTRKAPRPSRGVAADVEVSDVEKFFKDFPVALRIKVLDKAVRASGAPVRKAARRNLASHRSRQTGTREKWSEKVRARRGDQKDLHDSMWVKVRHYGSLVMAIVGPRLPAGAVAHLLEFGGNRILWGKGSYTAKPMPFMRPAYDETKSEQKKAMVEKVRKEWKKA